MKITEYSVVYKLNEDKYLIYFDTAEELFRYCAKIYVFSDCETEDYEILFIRYKGYECYYCGWEPGMRVRFKNSLGEEVWDEIYPEWEH